MDIEQCTFHYRKFANNLIERTLDNNNYDLTILAEQLLTLLPCLKDDELHFVIMYRGDDKHIYLVFKKLCIDLWIKRHRLMYHIKPHNQPLGQVGWLGGADSREVREAIYRFQTRNRTQRRLL